MSLDYGRVQNEEYEIQHFGFSSSRFLQEIRNLTDEVKNTLEWLKSVIPNESIQEKAYDAEKLYLECEKLIEHVIKNLEKDVKAYFAIPKNVLLPEDTNTSEPFSDHDIQNLEKEIAQLENQYIKKRTFIYLCEKEVETLASLEYIQEKVKEIMKKSEKLTECNSDELQKLIMIYDKLVERSVGELNFKPNIGFKHMFFKK